MSKIPSSSWIIDKMYFKACPVKDFGVQYIMWLCGGQGYTLEDLDKDYFKVDDDSLQKLIYSIESKNVIELYQFPFECNSNNCKTVKYEEHADYFEKEDDNWVITRHLFEIIEEK